MRLRILALAAALIGALTVPPSFAQRGLKAQQKSEEESRGELSRRARSGATPHAPQTALDHGLLASV